MLLAGDLTVPRVGRSSPPIRFSSVLLPEPGRPHQREELARRHLQMQVLQDVDVLRAAVKHLLHSVDVGPARRWPS